tara:strand:+ start:369 stop:872 length:504 start_codon:yes stop_codon:yes gene_type:complete
MLKDKIKSLIDILEESNINELEVSTFWGNQKIRLKKSSEIKESHMPINHNISSQIHKESNKIQNIKENIDKPDVDAVENNIIDAKNDSLQSITAPLVGTFYSRPKPDADSFIEIGSIIKKGDVICIIEAMKIFNEIESEVSGEVVDILIDDSNPVEFGQELFHIKEK